MSPERFNLRAERMNRGMSVNDLAAATGIDRKAITRLEGGGGCYPATAKPIADYFGVKVTDLMPLEDVAA